MSDSGETARERSATNQADSIRPRLLGDLLAAERAAREAAERSAARMSQMLSFTTSLAEADTQEDVADAALRAAIAIIGAAAGGIGVVTADPGRLHRLAIRGYPPEISDATRDLTIDGLGPIGDTVRTGEAIWLQSHADLIARYPDLASIPQRERYGATISVPLMLAGRIIGVMALRFAGARPFDADDRDLMLAIAGQCSQALERARLFDAERAARAEAERAVRVRDEFLSIASHELKTPVAALKGSAQLMLRRIDRGNLDQERLVRSLEVMNETADRLNALTTDLLDVSRIASDGVEQALHEQEFDLVDLVTDAIERSGYQLDGDHRVILSVHAQPLVITADANRLDQVITNLLENAIKYSPDGGEVVVTIRREADNAAVSVRDQGIGLPPGANASIFEPFGRAANAVDSNLPGIGLGLHIARTIVERHGGKITAESPGEGRGTTFRMLLPLARDLENDAT
jgi:K+-sensing histidine kinase KdpD